MQYESFEDVLALVYFGKNTSFGISNSNPASLKTTYHEESGESGHEEDAAEDRARSPAAVAVPAASLTLLPVVAVVVVRSRSGCDGGPQEALRFHRGRRRLRRRIPTRTSISLLESAKKQKTKLMITLVDPKNVANRNFLSNFDHPCRCN